LIADRDGLVISWVRLTDKKHFIDAWHQLDGVAVPVQTQMSLFVRGA
jgi:hypothetical protein